jgi:polysaccharide pyruvyl transferase WcaK-like protein
MVENAKQVLFFNDTTNWYHFGCTGTSTALKAQITKIGYNLTAVPITETYKLHSFPKTAEEFVSPENYQKFADANPETSNLIKDHPVIVINGEGTLHGMRDGPIALLYLAFSSKYFLNKHVEIINSSVYPNDDMSLSNEEANKLYKLVFDTINFVAIREPLSFKLMQELNVKAVESFDCLPLYIRDNYKMTAIKDNATLLVAGSAYWVNLNMLEKDKETLENLNANLEQFTDYLKSMSDEGYKVKFLFGAAAYPSQDDQKFITYLKENASFPLEVVDCKSLDEWLNNIEQATLLISGRFHHTIAAACLNTPYITLNSNTPKTESLLQALGHQKIFSFNEENLYSELKLQTQNINFDSRENNPNLMEELCAKATENFAGLRELYEVSNDIPLLTPSEVALSGSSLENNIDHF